jgi:homoserine trans-succinylase
MNDMYEVYKGFKDDVTNIFKPLIEMFHFKIEDVSDYGVTLSNNKCQLKIFCEVSLIVWYYNKEEYKNGILLTQYFYNKNRAMYNELNDFYFTNRDRKYFQHLCSFLIDNFSKELEEVKKEK